MTSQTLQLVLAVSAIASCGNPQRISDGGGGGGGGHSGKSSGPVPAEVRKTAEAIIGPTARITSDREGGVLIYEAAVQTKLELELSDRGALHKTEVALPVGVLPTAVVGALAGKGTISEAEVIVTPAGVAFAVEIENTEYLIDTSGKIVDQEVEADEPEDDED